MPGISVYELVEDKPVEVGYIPSDEEIDKQTAEKIRTKFSADEREKRLRLGAINRTNAEFVEYDNYANACVEEGKEKKEASALRRAELVEVTIQENEEDRILYTLPEEEDE